MKLCLLILLTRMPWLYLEKQISMMTGKVIRPVHLVHVQVVKQGRQITDMQLQHKKWKLALCKAQKWGGQGAERYLALHGGTGAVEYMLWERICACASCNQGHYKKVQHDSLCGNIHSASRYEELGELLHPVWRHKSGHCEAKREEVWPLMLRSGSPCTHTPQLSLRSLFYFSFPNDFT